MELFKIYIFIFFKYFAYIKSKQTKLNKSGKIITVVAQDYCSLFLLKLNNAKSSDNIKMLLIDPSYYRKHIAVLQKTLKVNEDMFKNFSYN